MTAGEEVFFRETPKAFAFLTDAGFAIIESEPFELEYRNEAGDPVVEWKPFKVEFQRGDVTVSISRDWRDGALDVDIALGEKGVLLFELAELKDPSEPQERSKWRPYCAYGPEHVREGLDWTAQVLLKFGAEALAGDPAFYDEVLAGRPERIRRWALKMNAPGVRSRASEAFVKGDYATAAKLYGEIREVLTDVELQKLAMAEQRSRQP